MGTVEGIVAKQILSCSQCPFFTKAIGMAKTSYAEMTGDLGEINELAKTMRTTHKK